MINNKREIAFDNLRIISAFAVVIMHVCAEVWYKLDVYSMDWMIVNVYDMVTKFCVPVFFMISGRFMLDLSRNYTINKITLKIKRIVSVFLFWSFIYLIIDIFTGEVFSESILDGIDNIITKLICGKFHMWFLYALVGLYLLTPIFRKIVEDKKLEEYFIVLCIIFGSVMPFMRFIPGLSGIYYEVSEKMQIPLILGYSGYYMLGHYLYKYPIKNKYKRLIVWMGTISIAMTTAGVAIMSRLLGVADESLAGRIMLNIMMFSVAIYIVFISNKKEHKHINGMKRLSEYSFGVYLCHPIFIMILKYLGIFTDKLSLLLSIPLVSVLVFGISMLLVWFMKKNRILNKFV